MSCSTWWNKQILLEPLLNSKREWMGSFSLCMFSGIPSKWFLATLLWCHFTYKPDIWFLGNFSYSYSVSSHPKSTLRNAPHVLSYLQPQTVISDLLSSCYAILCPYSIPSLPFCFSCPLCLPVWYCFSVSFCTYYVSAVSLGKLVALKLWSLRQKNQHHGGITKSETLSEGPASCVLASPFDGGTYLS